jgi:NAD+ kinase
MKIAICSTEKEKIRKILTGQKFEIVENNPDFVFCYGGDGTILYGERRYPEIPKLWIRKNGKIKDYNYSLKVVNSILDKIKNGKYKIVEEMKLMASYKNNKLTALNEIQIHTKLPIGAIRFSVNAKRNFSNLIGDGVIVSTPFGSTGYYSAAGGKPFKNGIGVCFNNIHSGKIPSIVLPENSKIKIKLDRDSAILLNDNNPKYYDLKAKDEITIQKSQKKAKFIKIKK